MPVSLEGGVDGPLLDFRLLLLDMFAVNHLNGLDGFSYSDHGERIGEREFLTPNRVKPHVFRLLRLVFFLLLIFLLFLFSFLLLFLLFSFSLSLSLFCPVTAAGADDGLHGGEVCEAGAAAADGMWRGGVRG